MRQYALRDDPENSLTGCFRDHLAAGEFVLSPTPCDRLPATHSHPGDSVRISESRRSTARTARGLSHDVNNRKPRRALTTENISIRQLRRYDRSGLQFENPATYDRKSLPGSLRLSLQKLWHQCRR